MANRPLPNVDPDALSKLASQYPGSVEGRAEPKLGGGSGSGGAGSGSGGSGPDGPGSGSGGSSGPVGGGERANTARSAPKPAAQPRPAGRSAVVLTFLFAIVAVTAAVAALAAPSLRSETRSLLARVPQISPEWADFITGQDTGRLEITYAGLDQRIARLTEALDRAAKVGGDPAVARELLLQTEQNQRLGVAETKVAEQGDALSGLATRLGALDERLGAFEEVRKALDGLTARADAADQSLAGVQGSVQELQGAIGELKASLVQLGEADSRTATAVEEMSRRLDTVAADVSKAHADLVPVATLANLVQQQRRTMELPLIGMTQLRIALDGDAPYKQELALARKLVGDDVESLAALAALDASAGSGVATLPGLRRDFTFVATQMGGTLMRVQSWTQRLSTWVEVLVGTRSVPEADPVGEISSAVASIDAALEAGQLDLAIDEAEALNGRRSDVLLVGWIAEARRRLANERAFERLSARVYVRLGNSS